MADRTGVAEPEVLPGDVATVSAAREILTGRSARWLMAAPHHFVPGRARLTTCLDAIWPQKGRTER